MRTRPWTSGSGTGSRPHAPGACGTSAPRMGCRWPGGGAADRLELVEVALDLPVADLGSVFVPFGALGRHVVAEDVVAEGAADDVVAFELVERLAERAGQLAD